MDFTERTKQDFQKLKFGRDIYLAYDRNKASAAKIAAARQFALGAVVAFEVGSHWRAKDLLARTEPARAGEFLIVTGPMRVTRVRAASGSTEVEFSQNGQIYYVELLDSSEAQDPLDHLTPDV